MSALDVCREAFFPLTIIVFVLGTCIGSFLNVVIWRLPRGEFLSTPPSHCPKCQHAIRPWENIPILSWLALRGRCSSCGEPISIRYPAIELLTAVAFLCVWFRVLAQSAPPVRLFPLFFLVSALIAVTFTDIETRTIPNKITYSGIGFGLVFVLIFPSAYPAACFPAVSDFFSRLNLLPFRLIPFFETAAGVLVTVTVLWAVRVLTSVIFGRRALPLEGNQTARLSKDGFFAGDLKLFTWDEIVSGEMKIKRPAGSAVLPELFGSAGDGSEVVLRYRKGVVTGRGWKEEVHQLSPVDVEGISVTVTRDAFGWGDIKLIAMIGALLGAGALPFVLILSTIPGMVIGGLMTVLSPACRKQGVPFAPFLSLGCLIWIFFGDVIVSACYKMF